MFSVAPTRYSSPSPALTAAAAMASADALDAQTRLTVMAGTSSGMPAFSSAWRAMFWPRPAWITLPKMTSSSCSPLTPARLSASVIAIAPSSTAGVLAKPPWKRPCAVRTAERMTMSLSGTVSSSCRRVCGCSPRREIHALHHDTLIDGRLVNGTSSRLFVTADDFLRHERGDLDRRGARPEAGVVAELLGERVIDAWSSDHDHEAFAHALGLEQLDELGEVLDVDVLLRDDLAHQDGVGIALERRLEELRAGDLRAHVERFHLGIALQAVVPGEALHVHDGVDADRVCVALDGRADDAEPAPELLFDEGVDGVVVHLLDLEVVPFDLVGIDAGVGAAVGHVKRVLGVDGLALGDAHGVEAELLQVLLADVGGLDLVGDRQGEGELNDPVVTSIAVRSY